MIENFDHLVKKIGHITNGNRVYYNRRSQPPLFPHMVQVKYVTKMIKYKNDQNCWFINGFWFRITWHPMTTSSTSESCWMRWSLKTSFKGRSLHYNCRYDHHINHHCHHRDYHWLSWCKGDLVSVHGIPMGFFYWPIRQAWHVAAEHR